MKRTTLLFGLLLVGGLYFTLYYHVILTDDGVIVEHKTEPGFEDSFVNARGWGVLDHIKHPKIAGILISRHAQKAIDGALEGSKKTAEDGKKKLDQVVKELFK